MENLRAFRLGDIRGIYPDDIDEKFIQAFAHAFVGHFALSGSIATGRDMRASSESLHRALNEALSTIGIEVVDMGLCPTEVGYFASSTEGVQAAIVVTASHNPAAYNGIKCVLSGGRAVTTDAGLAAIQTLMQQGYRHTPGAGSIRSEDFHSRFLSFLRDHFQPATIQAGAIALNGLNGTAATMAGVIADAFDLDATWFRKTPGPIPEEGADPANPRLAAEMKQFMTGGQYALGIAWDGDCDRCVFFDNAGQLVPTYYMVGLIADRFLTEHPGASIVFDTKLCWNTLDIIQQRSGVPVPAATGHAFMKQKMLASGAVYGGELSSHHYFGDFFGCDSGMFAWLTVLKLLHESDAVLHDMIEERASQFCCTPEISLRLLNTEDAFARLTEVYGERAERIDYLDGLAMEMPGGWRFSLRRSKTEDLVRLNFEALGDTSRLLFEAGGVLEMLEAYRGDDRDWTESLEVQFQ